MKTIGILGGGQLALMMLPAFKKLGLKVVILDKDGSPCQDQEVDFVTGDYALAEDCLKLKECDVVTFEIENISLEGLEKLSKVTTVYPSPNIFKLIQDKGAQKNFLQKIDVPTSAFKVTTLTGEVSLENKVVKLTKGGYDGKGVWIPKSKIIPESFIDQECVIEERVQIYKEIGVVCTRTSEGEMALYEPVEMVMDPVLNLLSYQQNPADITDKQEEAILAIVTKIATELDYVGTMAVEFFLDLDQKIWVNELAPRVHNSGHNTIESAPCNQFENHVRAIAGLPLGSARPALASITANLIGTGEVGETQVLLPENIGDDVFIHLYNKKESRPGRKMGHVTIIGNKEELLEKKKFILDKIKITGK